MASSAHASTTTSHGCTITSLQPQDGGRNYYGTKIVYYPTQVGWCYAGRTVVVEDLHYTEVPGPNPRTGSAMRSLSYLNYGGYTTLYESQLLQNSVEGCEPVYHNIRFQVTLSDGTKFPWTSTDQSPKACINN